MCIQLCMCVPGMSVAQPGTVSNTARPLVALGLPSGLGQLTTESWKPPCPSIPSIRGTNSRHSSRLPPPLFIQISWGGLFACFVGSEHMCHSRACGGLRSACPGCPSPSTTRGLGMELRLPSLKARARGAILRLLGFWKLIPLTHLVTRHRRETDKSP